MKFGRYLQDHAIPEWRKGYIDYRRLKKIVRKVNEQDFSGIRDEETQVESSRSASRDRGDDAKQSASKRTACDEPSQQSTSRHENTGEDSATPTAPNESNPTLSDPSPPATEASQPARRLVHDQTTTTQKPQQYRTQSSRPLSHFFISPGLRIPSRSARQQQKTTIDEVWQNSTSIERRFFAALNQELDKVVAFFDERKTEAINRYADLSQQTKEYQSRLKNTAGSTPVSNQKHNQSISSLRTALAPNALKTTFANVPYVSDRNVNNGEKRAVAKSLKIAIFEFYRFLGMLQNYKSLNRAGFSKILKKFDKASLLPASVAYTPKVNATSLVESKVVDELLQATEDLFADTFTKGSRKKALERLRVLGSSKMHHFSSFRSGTMLGLALPPLVDGLHRSFQPEVRESIPYWPALLQLYGAFVLPIVFSLAFHINLIFWHRHRINYVLIFAFDIRNMLDFRQFLEIPTLLLFTICYAFWLSFANFWPSHLEPWVYLPVWVALAVVIICLPFPVLNYQARWWFLRNMARVCTAGLFRVEFRDFFFGDQLVSMYYPLYNIGLLICGCNLGFRDVPSQHCNTNSTYVSAVLAALPALARLGQSFRRYHDSGGFKIHLVNAGKYTMNTLYLFMYFHWRVNGSFHDFRFILFIVIAVINSLWSLAWDILMDWNLLKPNKVQPGLRAELGYPQSWVYYVASVLDFMGRFSWVIYLPSSPSVTLRGWIVGTIEISRRAMWNSFRVESEHVGNVDGFRVTRDVPLPYTITASNDIEPEAEAEASQAAPTSSDAHLAGRLRSLIGVNKPDVGGQIGERAAGMEQLKKRRTKMPDNRSLRRQAMTSWGDEEDDSSNASSVEQTD